MENLEQLSQHHQNGGSPSGVLNGHTPFKTMLLMGWAILIISEEPSTQKYMQFNLARRGFEVFSDDYNMLQHLRVHYDIAIVEIGNPSGKSIALLQQMRRESAAPLILLTSSPMDGPTCRLAAAAETLTLTKPFGIQQLLTAIRSFSGGGPIHDLPIVA